jgi:hypothetical protein
MARSLDQLRQADPRRFAEERQQFAMRQADVSNWWALRGTGQRGGGPGNRGGDRGGQAGDRGRRGGDRGGGGGNEDALRREQARQQLADPAVQARIRPYLALADQVRRLPEATYQQQRMKLAMQVWQSREERRVQTNPRESIDNFITRVLLTPVTVGVLEAKLKGSGIG